MTQYVNLFINYNIALTKPPDGRIESVSGIGGDYYEVC